MPAVPMVLQETPSAAGTPSASSPLARELAATIGLVPGPRVLVLLRESERQVQALAGQLQQSLECLDDSQEAAADELADWGMEPYKRRHPDVLSLDGRNHKAAMWRSGSVYVLAVLGSAAAKDAQGATTFLTLLEDVCRTLTPETLIAARPDRIIRTRGPGEQVLNWLKDSVKTLVTPNGRIPITDHVDTAWWDEVIFAARGRETVLKNLQNGRGAIGATGKWFHKPEATPLGTQRGSDGRLEIRAVELPVIAVTVHALAQGRRRQDIAREIVQLGLPPNRETVHWDNADKRLRRACEIVDKVVEQLADMAMGVHVFLFGTMGTGIEYSLKQSMVYDQKTGKHRYKYVLPLPPGLLDGIERATLAAAIREATERKLRREAEPSAWLAELRLFESGAVPTSPMRQHRWMRKEGVSGLDSWVAQIIEEATPKGYATSSKSTHQRSMPFTRRPAWRGPDGREYRLAAGAGAYQLLGRDSDQSLEPDLSLARPWGPPSRYPDRRLIQPSFLHEAAAHTAAKAISVGAPYLQQQYRLAKRHRSPVAVIDRLAAARSALAAAVRRTEAAYEELLHLREQQSPEGDTSPATQEWLLKQARSTWAAEAANRLAAEDRLTVLEQEEADQEADVEPQLPSDHDSLSNVLVDFCEEPGPVPRALFDAVQRLLPRLELESLDSRTLRLKLWMRIPDVDGIDITLGPLTSQLGARARTGVPREVPLAMQRADGPIANFLVSADRGRVEAMQNDLVALGAVSNLQAALAALESPVQATRLVIVGRTEPTAPWQHRVRDTYSQPDAFPADGAAYWYRTGTVLQEALDTLHATPWQSRATLRAELGLSSGQFNAMLNRATTGGYLLARRRNAETGLLEFNALKCEFCSGTMNLHLPVPEINDVLCGSCLRDRTGVQWPAAYRDAVELVRTAGRRRREDGVFKSGHRSRYRDKTSAPPGSKPRLAPPSG